jgi:hypothetical protein
VVWFVFANAGIRNRDNVIRDIAKVIRYRDGLAQNISGYFSRQLKLLAYFMGIWGNPIWLRGTLPLTNQLPLLSIHHVWQG